MFLWAKDTWVEINFIFTVFGLVKTEGIGNSPRGGGGGEGEGVGETKVGEKTLLVFSCLVGSGKWVVPCTFHRAHQNLISPNWRKNGRENWKELRITILSLENH